MTQRIDPSFGKSLQLIQALGRSAAAGEELLLSPFYHFVPLLLVRPSFLRTLSLGSLHQLNWGRLFLSVSSSDTPLCCCFLPPDSKDRSSQDVNLSSSLELFSKTVQITLILGNVIIILQSSKMTESSPHSWACSFRDTAMPWQGWGGGQGWPHTVLRFWKALVGHTVSCDLVLIGCG